jgi:hypothetical protein
VPGFSRLASLLGGKKRSKCHMASSEEKKPDASEPINIKVVTQDGNEICARLANGPSFGSPDGRRRLS